MGVVMGVGVVMGAGEGDEDKCVKVQPVRSRSHLMTEALAPQQDCWPSPATW